MSEASFYQILGVGRSASAGQIRSAYRDLVKRYHPDLFSTAGEKAAATEKLRLINEAYAVLGNAERRQRYDQEFVQKPQMRRRAPTADARRKAARPRRRQAEGWRKTFKMPKLRLSFSRKWTGYSLAAATLLLVLIYASRSVPRLITAWTLVEKVEVSPPRSGFSSESAQGWAVVGRYASVSECAGSLKEKVRKDEQEGSRAVFGEPNGTMAITVFIKKASIQEQPSTADAIPSQTDGATKRVRNLECRATQRVETESRFQRTLRGWGLLQ
jgi:hypothetical protein